MESHEVTHYSKALMSGIEVILLQRPGVMAKKSLSFCDDMLFRSQISAALYLLPLLFTGIGINVLSPI